jgi:hypothetical protein
MIHHVSSLATQVKSKDYCLAVLPLIVATLKLSFQFRSFDNGDISRVSRLLVHFLAGVELGGPVSL